MVVDLTCRLPLGQYSVRIAVFSGSTQAPINLVRLSWVASFTCTKVYSFITSVQYG